MEVRRELCSRLLCPHSRFTMGCFGVELKPQMVTKLFRRGYLFERVFFFHSTPSRDGMFWRETMLCQDPSTVVLQ